MESPETPEVSAPMAHHAQRVPRVTGDGLVGVPRPRPEGRPDEVSALTRAGATKPWDLGTIGLDSVKDFRGGSEARSGTGREFEVETYVWDGVGSEGGGYGPQRGQEWMGEEGVLKCGVEKGHEQKGRWYDKGSKDSRVRYGRRQVKWSESKVEDQSQGWVGIGVRV